MIHSGLRHRFIHSHVNQIFYLRIGVRYNCVINCCFSHSLLLHLLAVSGDREGGREGGKGGKEGGRGVVV